MKKTKVEGTNVVLLKSLDKKIVRKYKSKETNAYPKTVKEQKILKLLENTNIKHPKLLKNRFKYIEIEYLEGKTLPDLVDKKVVISLLCNYVYEMYNVNCDSIKKKLSWNNNTTFLYYHVNNLLLYVRKNDIVEKLREMGINFSVLLNLKNMTLDNERKLSLIHGEITTKNIIDNNGSYMLIDWEHATYGDIAYELAMHFVNEEYEKEQMNIVLDRLSASLGINEEKLSHDINIYINFEYYRKSICGFIDAIKLKNKKQPYEQVLFKTYNYYSKLQNPLSLETLRTIIEK